MVTGVPLCSMLPFFKRRIVLLFRRCDLPIQVRQDNPAASGLVETIQRQVSSIWLLVRWCEGDILKLTRKEKTATH
jgi:hypothetical protein